MVRRLSMWMAVLLGSVALTTQLHAARTADVTNTKHNLSVSGPGTVKATTESGICVFCHTPHGAESAPAAPLWNRTLSSETYTPYTSSSINASDIASTPGGSSKLCLSCHDGTLAIGSVNVANGQIDPTISMGGTDTGGTMATGEGATTGFTRKLGVDLTNDHPISFTYDSTLATADGELRDPSLVSHIATRSPGVRPAVPLESGKMECISCHDPHLRDDTLSYSIKFLRLNRFQQTAPSGGSFDENNDIICLACHDKLGSAWADSVHADSTVADEIYQTAASDLREFPSGIRVWEASCLNCHDTHTVQGSRRLLREGTDAAGGPATAKQGGSASIEDTCYQCHTTAAESVLTSVTEVPNIESDFSLARRMPISTSDQQASSEMHDITNADFVETQAKLGKTDQTNRHAECTDCHNPHRVIRNNLFNGSGGLSTISTHDPNTPTNIASGALRGTFGVEPNYGSTSFHALPSSYTVKKGDGGSGASTAVGSSWVTREYQICLKCHSDYGYSDNNVYPVGNRPNLGSSGGGTTSGTNGLTQYTNQAKEFQAPVGHRGEGISQGYNGGAGTNDGNGDFNTNNHRSWHPVMGITGRNATARSVGTGTSSPWLTPWRTNLGNQTMYCTDCHGSDTEAGTAVPTGSNPWGPHGSTKNFILKGDWDSGTGSSQSNDLCFKCHRYDTYPADGGANTGFRGGGKGDLHSYHRNRIGSMRCTWCHVAVPHGWKNKSFLVNLNDVGPEAGKAAGGEEVCTGSLGWGSGNGGCSTNNGFTAPPYYLNAFLKIRNFRASGSNWVDDDCGTTSSNDGDSRGVKWMKNEACDAPN